MVTGLFWEAHQQRRINSASADAARARDRVARLKDDVRGMQRRIERMGLASQALWELLRDNTDFQEEHILAKMEEIDLRDGQTDGKIGHQILTCPSCGRAANTRRAACVYCGSELARDHVFE